jgi:phospholipid/cholesterol/gamma-HCH transport system substrate-binding protein
VIRGIQKYSRDFIALIVLFLIGIGVAGYVISQQESRPVIPLIEEKPMVLRFEFSDAQAVVPGQGQSVRVAGVEVGKIRRVEPRAGVALVKTEIQKKFWDRLQVRSDATGLLRPRTGLKDMFIELDPGGRGELLPTGATIPVENTAPDVDPDEVLSALDTDTRAYLQLLINGAGKGLKGRGDDLNKVFKSLGPTQRDLNRVTSAVAERREALKELIHRYGSLTTTLAQKDREIRRLVSASHAVFRAFASQEQNISLAVSKLPGTLRQTETTLIKANRFARVLRPTLNSLRAPFRQLDVTNREIIPFVREAYPITKNRIRPFVRTARPVVRDLRPGAVNLARATPDFVSAFYELNRFFNMAAFNPNGAEPVTGNPTTDRAREEGYLFWVGWVGMLTDSMFSTSDANGAFRRAALGIDCATIRQQVTGNPAAGPLIGLSNVLNDTALCGSGSGAPGGGPLPGLGLPGLPPLPKGAAGKTTSEKPRDGKAGGPAQRPAEAATTGATP